MQSNSYVWVYGCTLQLAIFSNTNTCVRKHTCNHTQLNRVTNISAYLIPALFNWLISQLDGPRKRTHIHLHLHARAHSHTQTRAHTHKHRLYQSMTKNENWWQLVACYNSMYVCFECGWALGVGIQGLFKLLITDRRRQRTLSYHTIFPLDHIPIHTRPYVADRLFSLQQK